MRRIIICEKPCIISFIQKINYVLTDKKFKAHYVKYFLFETLLQNIVCKYDHEITFYPLFEIYFDKKVIFDVLINHHIIKHAIIA